MNQTNDKNYETKKNTIIFNNIPFLNNLTKFTYTHYIPNHIKNQFNENSKSSNQQKSYDDNYNKNRKFKRNTFIVEEELILRKKIISVFQEEGYTNNDTKEQECSTESTDDINDYNNWINKIRNTNASIQMDKENEVHEIEVHDNDNPPKISIHFTDDSKIITKSKPKRSLFICCCQSVTPPSTINKDKIDDNQDKIQVSSIGSYTASTEFDISKMSGANFSEMTCYKDLFVENSQSSRHTLAIGKIKRDSLKPRIRHMHDDASLDNTADIVSSGIFGKEKPRMGKQESDLYGKEDTEELFLDWFRENLKGFDYKFVGFLGEGTFGKVWCCRDLKHPPHRVALKITKKDPKYRKLAMHEVQILNKIKKNDPGGKRHIVLFRGYFKVEKHLIIIFPEYGDNIYQYLKSVNYYGMRLDDVYYISYQVWDAVDFLHNLMVIHTDIKPENLLFVTRDYRTIPYWNPSFQHTPPSEIKVPIKPDIVLIDLGNAITEVDSKPRVIVTRYYRPPEVYLEVGWDSSADIWSIGCVMYELYVGRSLFQCRGDLEHMWMIEFVLNKFPRDIIIRSKVYNTFFDDRGHVQTSKIEVEKLQKRMSQYKILTAKATQQELILLQFINRCLVYNPSKRITPKEALSQEIFNKTRKLF